MISIKDARKLLPEKTMDLADEQVRFILSQIGEVTHDEFSSAWDRELELRMNEMTLFLNDVYTANKHKSITDN